MEFQSTINGYENKEHAETWDDRKQRLETLDEDWHWLMQFITILELPKPDLDVFASEKNRKCDYYLDKEYDSLKNDFLIKGKYAPDASWIQPPFGIYAQVLEQIDKQFVKYDLPMYALVPSRFEKNPVWGKYVENHRIDAVENGHVFYIPIQKNWYFKIDGKLMTSKKGEIMTSPDGFKLTLWIPKRNMAKFKENLPKLYKWLYDEQSTKNSNNNSTFPIN